MSDKCPVKENNNSYTLLQPKQKITNSDYWELNRVSKRTTTTELTNLVEKHQLIDRKGTSGSNIFYQIK